MLSKNNRELLNQKMESKKQRFAIKHLTVGVASVLVGTLFMVQGGDTKAQANSVDQPEDSAIQSDSISEQVEDNEVVLGKRSDVSETVVDAKSDLDTRKVDGKEEGAETETSLKTVDTQNIVSEETKVVDETALHNENVNEKVPDVTTQIPKNTNSSFRAAQESDEVLVYQFAGQRNYEHAGDNMTAKVTLLEGYVKKSEHTNKKELVRWVIKYKPTVVAGKATAAPVGVLLNINSSYELPSSISFNGRSISRDFMSSGNGVALYYSNDIKANIGVENTIEFTTPVRGRLKVTGISFDFATSNNPNDKNKIDPSNHSYPLARNLLVASSKLDEKTYNEFIKELEAPEDKVETTNIPYTTEYQADPTLEAGQKVVTQAGIVGEKTTTTTYVVQNGNIIEHVGEPVVTKEPVTEIVKVGTKAKVEKTEEAFNTIYRGDETRTAKAESVANTGVKGEITTTTTYTLDTKTGNVIANEPTSTTTRKKIDRVIIIGTKPTVVETELPFKTVVELDKTMTVNDPEVIVTVGKIGKKTVTTTYTVAANGTLTENATEEIVQPVDQVVKRGAGENSEVAYKVIYKADETKQAGEKEISVKGQKGLLHPNGTVLTPAVDEVVLVGTKPSVSEEVLKYTTRYEDDATMKAEETPIVLVAGKAGKKVTTITYKLDVATGKVTANAPEVETTEPVTEVIKRGVGQDSEIAYQVTYKADETKTLGVKAVSVKGQNGIMHPNGTITQAPVTEVILVGIKPNVAEVAIPYHVVLIEDSTMLKTDPKVEVVAGKDGKAITTTSYALDETTGLVTVANVDKELIPAIDQEIKVGVGENEEIMYETRYVADETLEAGVKEVRVTGQVGVRHPNGTVTTEPVTEIIAVGTMPKVTEEVLGFETIYQEDPNLPLGEMCVITPGKEGIKRLITTYKVDEVTGELIEMTTEEISEPQTEIVAKGTKVSQKEVVKTPEVKSVVAQAKEQPVTKAQELPQMGDKNEVNAMLLGSLGILSTLGLAAFGKKRKEKIRSERI